MADIHGGRVLAGEDSEDDEEEDDAISFQFGGFGGAQSNTPRFSAPVAVVAPGGGEESDESDEDGDENAVVAEFAAEKETEESEEEKEGSEASSGGGEDGAAASEAAGAGGVKAASGGDGGAAELEEEALWSVDPAMDGVQVMGDAFVRSIQPSLDATIQRIEELRSNQKDLLQLLVEQNAAVASNKQIEDVAVVMDKLPHYFTKVQMIRAAMTEISASVDRMKRRAESLRVDAQSHAIKKENKRDALSQWNKLAAKGVGGSSS